MTSVYVGTYGKYASGSIAGAWLDMEDFTDSEDFYNACHKLHKGEHDPEFMFQDYEGFPEGMISESHIDEKFWEWIELEDHQKEMIEAFHEAVGDTEADFDHIEDCFCGAWKDFSDFVYDSFTSCNDIPDHLANFIDWEHVEREWEMDHYYADINGSCFVFRNY